MRSGRFLVDSRSSTARLGLVLSIVVQIATRPEDVYEVLRTVLLFYGEQGQEAVGGSVFGQLQGAVRRAQFDATQDVEPNDRGAVVVVCHERISVCSGISPGIRAIQEEIRILVKGRWSHGCMSNFAENPCSHSSLCGATAVPVEPDVWWGPDGIDAPIWADPQPYRDPTSEVPSSPADVAALVATPCSICRTSTDQSHNPPKEAIRV